MDVEGEIKLILRKRLDLKGIIKPEFTIEDELGADSLEKFELISDAEDKFQITIVDEEISTTETVQDFIDLINKKLLVCSVKKIGL